MTKIKYLLKEKLDQLPRLEYAPAIKLLCNELQISKATLYREIRGESGDIPHYRFLQYCKFLSITDQELEDFDRDEISIRPLKFLKEKKERAIKSAQIKNSLGLTK